MPRGIAVCIGVNRVDLKHYLKWPGGLRACELDAKDMAKIATSRGFKAQKILTKEATRENITSSIKHAAKTLTKGDMFLLTYSGHGSQIKDDSGDEWKDALDRTWNQIQSGKVGNVILQLGSNDVCAEYGHDYGSLAFVQPSTPDNIVSIEAEHFIQRISNSTHQWEPDRIIGASITAVSAQPDSGTSMPFPDYLTLSPRLDYRVNFVRTGIHYIWMRGYAIGTADYLVHVGLNGQRQSTAENIQIKEYNKGI